MITCSVCQKPSNTLIRKILPDISDSALAVCPTCFDGFLLVERIRTAKGRLQW